MVTNLYTSLSQPSAFHLIAKLQVKSDRESAKHTLQFHCPRQILLATKIALQAPHPHNILYIAAAYVVVSSRWYLYITVSQQQHHPEMLPYTVVWTGFVRIVCTWCLSFCR